jgi:phage-related protein
MNEELKIIIKAVTSDAKKNIQGIKKELDGVSKGAKGASGGFSAAMKGFGKAAGLAVAAVSAVVTAIVVLGKKTLELQKTQAKLNTAFQAMGSTAQQAAESYRGLFRFLGDNDKSVEAASHLAKLTTNQQELAEWTKVCQGIYATFGDSLPIEGLTEAANESARVGQVTGTLADALNWAGVSEDEFNAKLAETTSFEEREALIRSTLNGLYSDAADIYEKNNKALLEHNESQARVNESLARTGASVTPLLTAFNNLSAAILDALKPAFDVIIPAIATVVDWLTKGIQAVMAFFGVVSGKSSSVNTFAEMGAGLAGAAGGAGDLTSGLEDTEKAAKAAKKAMMGFDELNVVSSGSSSGGAAGSDGPGYMAPTVDASKFTMEVEETESEASGFAKMMQDVADQLKDVFAPTITAWSGAFDTIKQAWEDTKPRFINGAKDIASAFTELGGYVVGTFVPDVVNSFSENLAPVFADVFAFKLEEAGKNFELFGGIIKDATSTLIIPALESVKTVLTDTFGYIGSAWEKHGEPLMAKLTEAMDHIRSTISNLYEQFIKPIGEKIVAVFNSVWENGLGPMTEKFVDAVLEIGQCLLDLYNEFLAPIVDWIVANIVPVIREYLERLIEHFGQVVTFIANAIGGVIDAIKGIVQFITGVFTGDWEKAWEGIKNIFSGVWDAIVGIAQAAWELIKYPFEEAGEYFKTVCELIKKAWDGIVAWFGNIFKGIKDAFKDAGTWFTKKFEEAKTGVQNAFKTVGTWFGDRWKDIKNAFSATGSWFKTTFETAYANTTNAFKNAKTGFANVWSNIKAGFGNVSDWFKNTFSKAWEAVKNVFSSGGKIFDGIKDGILSGLKAVINKLIDGINKVVKVPFDGINSALRTIKNTSIAGIKPFSWLPTISVPQIPRLAKGGIIDQATLALIGERGKEAVVPLENNTEWIDKLVDKLAARNSGPEKIVLMLDGRELGWANIKSINNITRQTGALQLTLV